MSDTGYPWTDGDILYAEDLNAAIADGGAGLGITSVVSYGAIGDGVTDNAEAFQDAALAVKTAGGGMILVPSGDFVVSAVTALASNTTVVGLGQSSRIIAAAGFLNPPGDNGQDGFFYNETWGATALTDHDIHFRDLYFDMTRIPGAGEFAAINLRSVGGASVRGCFFDGGGDGVAVRHCNNVTLSGNSARDQLNCPYDFWESSTNCKVLGNYARAVTRTPVQMCNFNAINLSPDTGQVSDGFQCIGNMFDAIRDGSPCQFEPLGNSATNIVRNVIVAGNIFKRVTIAIRGAVNGILIQGNTFSDFPVNPAPHGELISCYPFFGGGTPTGIVISGNRITSNNANSGFGVIRCEASNALIVGNDIDGLDPADDSGIYTGTVTGVTIVGNRISNAKVTAPGATAGSSRIFTLNNARIGTYDASGGDVAFRVTTGNVLVFESPDAAGIAKSIFTMPVRAASSLLTWDATIQQQFGGANRYASNPTLAATGTTGAGAAPIGGEYGAVTSATVGVNDGVFLSPTTGVSQRVINLSGVVIKVYPGSSGGTLDGGGVGVPVTMANNDKRTFYCVNGVTGVFVTMAKYP